MIAKKLANQPWSPAAETAFVVSADPTQPMEAGGAAPELLRREFTAGTSSQTHARIADDVAAQTSRRIGTLAILTVITVVGMTILDNTLQPELAAAQSSPLYRLSALVLVLAGAGLAAIQRAGIVNPQTLLDLGLVFQVAGALCIALMDNAMPWADSVVRGSTAIAGWMAICVVIIPNRPWKSIVAAFASVAMEPCAHLLAAHILHYRALPWNRLLSYDLAPLFIAAWTPFMGTRIRRMQEDLSRTQELGSYRLERMIGRGGMGEVWLARHRFLRRDAAVKLVLARLLEQSDPSEQRQLRIRFELEAQAIASLRSPHTVAIYDYGLAQNGSLYYAMEFLNGLDAQTLVDRHGPLPAGRAISFLKQACESLEEAHDAGLVHRDVKPGNLFICRLGKRVDFVKVLDFGLVKALADKGQAGLRTTHGFTGTPAFMAPEQVRGDQVDPRSDIYALGCVAYFLLTGTAVFAKTSPMAVALAHATERPQPPSARSELPVPESLDRVVLACLEKRPADRPQSVAELRAMLEACDGFSPWTEAQASDWWALHRPEPVRKVAQ